jgi:hypothetical protein
MPAFLEKKLKAEYGAKSAIPYKVMNSMGVMRGSKETPKGAALAEKHARKISRVPPGKKMSLKNIAQAGA